MFVPWVWISIWAKVKLKHKLTEKGIISLIIYYILSLSKAMNRIFLNKIMDIVFGIIFSLFLCSDKSCWGRSNTNESKKNSSVLQ